MYDEKDKKFLKALKDQGVGPEEAFARLNKVKSQSQNTSKPIQPKEADYFGKGLLDFGKGVGQFGANAAATVGEGIGNAANFAGQAASYLDPMANANRITKTFTGFDSGYKSPSEQIGEVVQTGSKILADNAKNTSSKISGIDQNSGYAQGGNLLGTIANIVGGSAIGGAVGGGAKAGSTALATGKEIAKEVPKKLLPKLASFAGESLGSTQGAIAATEGRFAKPEELGLGLGIDSGFAGLGKAGTKLSDFFFRKIVPSTPTQLGKDAAKGIDVGSVLGKETGVNLSKGGVMKQVSGKIKSASNELDKLIKAADSGNSSQVVKMGEKIGFTAEDLLPSNAMQKVLNNKKLQLKFGDVESVKTQVASTIDEFKQAIGDKALSLEQVQNLKKQLGNSLAGFYNKTGDAKSTAKEIVNDIIRTNSKEIIENNVKGAKDINKRLQGLITVDKRLKSKGPSSGYLTDLISGVAYSGSQGGNSPVDYAKNLLTGIVGKRILTSTAAKSLAGNAFKGASKSSPIISNLAKNLAFKKS